MKRHSTLLSYLIAGVVVMCCFACERKEPLQITTSAEKTVVVQPVKPVGQPLRIGMGAMITPKAGYVYYQQLEKYLEKKLGRPVQLVDRENYDEMNALLESGSIDAAFVCAGPYVEGKKKFGMELLVMPLVNGKPLYYAYIIVHKDSPYASLKDLKGKHFAFTDPKSNTGKLVPTYMLARMNEIPEKYFGKIDYTYGHDKSIRAVAEKLVDGASVDSLIWEYAAKKSPELTAKTKIIAKSEPYGIPPMVVRPGIDIKLKQQLQELLLNAANDPEGKQILAGMMIDAFVVGNDTNYDSIRAINSWIEKQKK